MLHECKESKLSDIASIYLNLDSADKIFDKSELERFMGELLWEKPND